jgi:NAD(P)-dependent dehydrogenase (short-subunit alcohol dehydrogenase family)
VDLGLTDRVALVTGGSRGIGRAVAAALVREGAHVALLARHAEALEAVARDIGRKGTRVLPVVADTSDDAAVRAAVDEVQGTFGRLDIVVNAAARPATAGAAMGLENIADEDFHHELDTKVLGYLRVVRAAAPIMKRAGCGRIVNISGMNARLTGSVIGSVRNVAVVALTKNLADELGPHGIAVNAVHPGLTITEGTLERLGATAVEQGRSVDDLLAELAAATSSGRVVTATQVADVVVFLASGRAVAVDGETLAVDGGRRGSIWY